APPILTNIQREGKKLDVVAQVTKSGHVFVFNRETGKSIFPIEEVEIPASVIPEEEVWPTQPIPSLPAPFSRQNLTEDDLNMYSPDYDSLLKVFRNSKKGRFVPFSETPTIIFPGLNGGAEWGGAAVDPGGIMYVNSNEIPWVEWLIPTSLKKDSFSRGQNIYRNSCGSCHRMDRTGNPGSGYPSLVNVKQRLTQDEVSKIISNGQGTMPGFTQLTSIEKKELINFLFDKKEKEITTDLNTKIDSSNESEKVPWKIDGHRQFRDSEGVPGISPPWGTLTAINLNTGKHQWRIPLGNLEKYNGKESLPTGTENYGGPVATAGGLLFIAATKDAKIRAFNKKTGKLLWDFELPTGGTATPSTYEVNGKQYVVIAAGGGRLGLDKGDSIIAFALPESCCKN
ncbi:MAG TPA: c-type cytochrome, partial [Tissierellaceae bacterium]|nr:c-type cytochrome [Tissierellaceae bacterium]